MRDAEIFVATLQPRISETGPLSRSLTTHEQHLLKRLYLHPEELMTVREQDAWMRKRRLNPAEGSSTIKSLEARGLVRVAKINGDVLLVKRLRNLTNEGTRQHENQVILARMTGGYLGGRENAMGQTR